MTLRRGTRRIGPAGTATILFVYLTGRRALRKCAPGLLAAAFTPSP